MESSNPLLPHKQVYRNLVNNDNGGPTHVVQSPRNVEQVCHTDTMVKQRIILLKMAQNSNNKLHS